MRISDWSSDVCSSDLVLLDTTQDAADKGKAYSTGLLDKDLKKARITVEGKEQLLARIKATTVYDDLKGCDLIIEAVFEDRTVKADVTRKAEAVLRSEEHTSELQSLMRISYAVFCLKK